MAKISKRRVGMADDERGEEFGKLMEQRGRDFAEELENLGERFGRRMRHKSKNSGKLYRSGKNRVLGGVCGGIGEFLNVDPTIIRLVWIAFCFAWGFGFPFYFLVWFIIPRNPKHKW